MVLPILIEFQSQTYPYLCDDIITIIHYKIKHDFCKRCNKIIGTRNVNACFLNNYAVCFLCYHKCIWPK